MTRGTWIILENVGGPIDSHFVPEVDGEEPDLEVELVKVIQDKHWLFNEGDTIKFREGESEDTLFNMGGQAFA